jgi:hypothetical protein
MSAPLPLTSVFFSLCGPHPSHSGENVIVEAQHTPYVEPSSKHLNLGLNPSQSLTPVSIGVTDHHYLVLRPGQLQMLSSLSGERRGFVSLPTLCALDCGSGKYSPQQNCSGRVRIVVDAMFCASGLTLVSSALLVSYCCLRVVWCWMRVSTHWTAASPCIFLQRTVVAVCA